MEMPQCSVCTFAVYQVLYYHSLAGPDTRRPPTSAGELTANFTSEERLAMYEYTLQNAAGVATPQEILPLVCIFYTLFLLCHGYFNILNVYFWGDSYQVRFHC